jgi:hypothetical protein
VVVTDFDLLSLFSSQVTLISRKKSHQTKKKLARNIVRLSTSRPSIARFLKAGLWQERVAMNILNLPTEMLANIFTHYVHGRLAGLQDASERPSSNLRRISAHASFRTHDPVDLTHVCRLWRSIAISTPRLWASICVHNPESEGDVKMFELWLQRSAIPSGTYPLTLSIYQTVTSDGQALGQVIDLAISQHQRWKIIRLDLFRGSQTFFEPLYTAAPPSILRAFKLNFDSWEPNATRDITKILCSSPALQSVHFGPEFRHVRIDLVPWDRQTDVSFKILGPRPFFQILSSSAESLRHISVKLIAGSHTRGAISHVTARRLRSIDIGSFGETHFSDTFDNLTLPSLRELNLPGGFHCYSPEDQTPGWESLMKLLERSKCKLRVFTIGGFYTPELMTESLKSPLFQHLKTLKVTSGLGTHSNFPVQLLDALSEVRQSTQRPRLFPQLEVLVLESVCPVDRVREMVSARVAAYGGPGRSTPLRRVSAQRREVGGFVLDMDLTAVLPSCT